MNLGDVVRERGGPVFGYQPLTVLWGDGEAFIRPAPEMPPFENLVYPAGEYHCWEHRAPHQKCRCGWHAFKNGDDAAAIAEGGIFAEIVGKDHVVEHASGWRVRSLECVGIFEPFCGLGNCREPAVFGVLLKRQAGKWQTPLDFRCEEHAREALKLLPPTLGLGLVAPIPPEDVVMLDVVKDRITKRLGLEWQPFDKTLDFISVHRVKVKFGVADVRPPDVLELLTEQEVVERERRQCEEADARRRSDAIREQRAARNQQVAAQRLARAEAQNARRNLL